MSLQGLHPKAKGYTSVWPTTCCCEQTHESRINSELHTRAEMLQMFGRPRAAASIHIEYFNSGLHPRTKESLGTGPGRPVAAVAYTCVLRNTSIQGCTQISKVTRVWQIICCGEHTHLRRRIRQFSAAVRTHTCMCCRKINSGLVLPTKPCCENTHVCCSISQLEVASKDQRFQLQRSG